MKQLFLLLILVISGCITGSVTYDPEGPFKVIKVIDGDTLDLSNGDRIRLVGINTPEKKECYYQEAKDKLSELTLGKVVLLEKDKRDKDKYGRKLRAVYVNGLYINAELVEQGYARVYDEFPSLDFNELKELEFQAKSRNLGLWDCSVEVV